MTQYSSCWWLQDHIEFSFGGGVHACCYNYVDRRGKTVGNVLMTRIADDRFPAEAIAEARADIHRQIAAGTHAACNSCPVLSLAEWAPQAYLARAITMNVWSHCNLKCTYCVVGSPGFVPTHVSYSVEAVIADMLAGGHIDPTGTVAWGGGDISALPEFNALAAMYREYGMYQDFKTSAYKFLPGVANAIAAQRGNVEVSIDAGTPETYALVKGKEALDRVVANIARYREHGAVSLKYIGGVANLGDADIEGFARLVERLTPNIVTVTPEWSEAWTGERGGALMAQIAKLIGRLGQTGAHIIPSDESERKRIFPNSWAALETELSADRYAAV